MQPQNLINSEFIYAVVGVSRDPKKYGHRIFADLLNAGYKVYGVNPKTEEILGQKLYPNLGAVPVKIDVIDFVVPPPVVEQLLPEVLSLGIKKVWLQPGSESDHTIEYCEKHGIECIHEACIMVERHK